jgi:hypothetical protein
MNPREMGDSGTVCQLEKTGYYECGVSLFCACAQQQAGQQQKAGRGEQFRDCDGLIAGIHVVKYKDFLLVAQAAARPPGYRR